MPIPAQPVKVPSIVVYMESGEVLVGSKVLVSSNENCRAG